MTSIKTALSVLILLCVYEGVKPNNPSKNVYRNIPIENNGVDTVVTGKQLAKFYCKKCHIFPEPELLDKKTWVNSVLPNMGLRLGVRKPGVDPYDELSKEEVKIIKRLEVFPDTLLISIEEWNKIVDYYAREAPSKPIEQVVEYPITKKLPHFKLKSVSFDNESLPMTTMLKFNESSKTLFVGDAKNIIYELNDRMKLENRWPVPSAPVDIDFPKNGVPRVLTIGTIIPSDQKLGNLGSLYKDKTINKQTVDIQNLARPVQFATGDLNLDGKEDVVICAFGNYTGKLSWYDNFETTKEKVLKPLPGARKVEIVDFNNDMKPDIMVLMAQAQEQISIFYNQGDSDFKEKTVLSFPSVYGVSYFELVDFNEDGYLDILLTIGDNWDLSQIRKNYHGIRIYLNDGRDNFNETFFYPLYGVSKAVARDFDNDGDLDIAAISFHSDFDQPEHSFVYLSNNGDMSFKGFLTPKASNGKWLTMEVADYDNDGDLDIILGSYFHSIKKKLELVLKGVRSFPQLLVLRNEIN